MKTNEELNKAIILFTNYVNDNFQITVNGWIPPDGALDREKLEVRVYLKVIEDEYAVYIWLFLDENVIKYEQAILKDLSILSKIPEELSEEIEIIFNQLDNIIETVIKKSQFKIP
ncbi:MAG: hypothetical protein ABI472_11815 [Ginsengibacter sp.]